MKTRKFFHQIIISASFSAALALFCQAQPIAHAQSDLDSTDQGYPTRLDSSPQYDWDPTRQRWVRTGTYPFAYRTSSEFVNQSGRYRAFRGEIQGFRHLHLTSANGGRTEHTLVKVSLANGTSAVVDLGPKANLSGLDLNQGDWIWIEATRGRIDERPVLMAQQLEVNGETHTIVRTRAAQEDPGQVTVRGILRDYQEVNLDSAKKDQTFVRIRLQDGRSVIVNLGPEFEERFGMTVQGSDRRGDWVMIQGRPETVDGRRVIFADEIFIEGDDADRVDQLDIRPTSEKY